MVNEGEEKQPLPVVLVSKKQGKTFKEFSSFGQLQANAGIFTFLGKPEPFLLRGLPGWCNKEYKQNTKEGEVAYNPCAVVCSCSEYGMLAAAYPEKSLERCCVHITKFLASKVAEQLPVPDTQLIHNRSRYGAEELYRIQAGKDMWVAGRKTGSDWMNIYADGQVFSFNTEQKRWKNKRKPAAPAPWESDSVLPW